MRAFRTSWGWAPKIIETYRPENCEETSAELREQLGGALRKLDQMRPLLERFEEHMDAVNVSIWSIEYKIEGDHLQFIDWDSTDDHKVLSLHSK